MAAALLALSVVAGTGAGAAAASPIGPAPPRTGSPQPWLALGHPELAPGDEGPAVASLQRHLARLRFDPGPAVGRFDPATEAAVWALQKRAGRDPTGIVDAPTWDLLRSPPPARPATVARGPGNRVEIDLATQVLSVWSAGDELLVVSHVSTGNGEHFCVPGTSRCGYARTRPGRFTIHRQIEGWRIAPLGGLYNPLYFNGGIAIHGSELVPTWPDSHGCVRVPMHVAEALPAMLGLGDEVHVLEGEPTA